MAELAAEPPEPEASQAAEPSSGRAEDQEVSEDRLALVKSVRDLVCAQIEARVNIVHAVSQPRARFAQIVGMVAGEVLGETGVELNVLEQRSLVTMIMNDVSEMVEMKQKATAKSARPKSEVDSLPKDFEAPAKDFEPVSGYVIQPVTDRTGRNTVEHVTSSQSKVADAKVIVQPILMERIDVTVATQLPRQDLAKQITDVVTEISDESKLQLNSMEQRDLVTSLINDMVGHGPLEPLLADDSITDIMVNGAGQVWVERKGKLELSDVTFLDNAHVLSVATRIVTAVGRRIDESSPICDARLADGSRVNVIIPPLALDGPTISIRKFSEKKITLSVMEKQRNISPGMAQILKIAGRCRLNILISGGTGSGKTTTLNAISQLIEPGDRIVTIEDAAELQLQQPHVVRLETRPANLEGKGEITMRDLLKNALRMRPDRIILGEVRGGEVVDMLQAMNTGHDGSLCTVHANNPREALNRLDNMVGLAGVNLPAKAVRNQISQAIHMIVQVSRMRDGVRRITHITEIVGQEDEVILTQDLFTFQFKGETPEGRLQGEFASTGVRPFFAPKAAYFGLERALLEAMSWESTAA